MHNSTQQRNVRRAAKRRGSGAARRTAKLAMVAGSLTGTMAFAGEAGSVKLEIYRPSDDVQAERVYRVIQNAARQVCHPLESRELGRLRYYMRCMNQAVNMAVAQVHSDELTAFHLAQHGSGVPRL